MKKKLLSLALLFALPLAKAETQNITIETTPTLRGQVVPATPAIANDFFSHIAGSFTLANNYVWRGVTQTDNLPTIQGGLTYTFANGIYLNAWGTNVKFGNATVELDAALGYNGKISEDFIYMVNITRYNYPKASENNYNELNASTTYRFLVLTAGYTPNVNNTHGPGVYTNIGFTYDAPEKYIHAKNINVSGGIGHYNLDKKAGPSYNDFSLQIQKKLSERYLISLQWVGTFNSAKDSAGEKPPSNKYLVGAVTVSF